MSTIIEWESTFQATPAWALFALAMSVLVFFIKALVEAAGAKAGADVWSAIQRWRRFRQARGERDLGTTGSHRPSARVKPDAHRCADTPSSQADQ